GLATQHFIDELPGHAGPTRYVDSGMRWAGSSNVRALADPEAGPDSFSRADTENVARVLAGHIRRVRPQLVLTDEPDGGYGHPDHVHCSRVVSRAVEIAAAAQDGGAAGGAAENHRHATRRARGGAREPQAADTSQSGRDDSSASPAGAPPAGSHPTDAAPADAAPAETPA